MFRCCFLVDIWASLEQKAIFRVPNSHFQNEAKCKTFLVEMNFICLRINNHIHINGFALSLSLKQRPWANRKWPILESLERKRGKQVKNFHSLLICLFKIHNHCRKPRWYLHWNLRKTSSLQINSFYLVLSCVLPNCEVQVC